MRFCMVTTFYPPYHFGGDAVFVQALGRALVEKGHDVTVVHCLDAARLGQKTIGDRDESAPADDRIVVHTLQSRMRGLSPLITHQTGRPGLKRRKLQAIFSEEFDVVNFHNISLVGGPGVLNMTQAPVKLFTLHEHWLFCPTHVLWKNRARPCDQPTCLNCSIRSGVLPQLWRYTGFVRQCLNSVDALVSPSEFTARRHREAGIDHPIRVIPCFSDLSPPAPSNFAAPRRPTFLYVGRLTESKGIQELLQDFARLPDYDLIVVGDGKLQKSLKGRYADCENIRFVGWLPRNELGAQYRNATALILPSRGPEVLGLVALEAFAHGVPAIVRDAGGCREPVDLTQGGYVYDSTTDLVNAVHSLAGNPQLRAAMGQRAREGYEKYYSQEVYLAAYFDLIDGIRTEAA